MRTHTAGSVVTGAKKQLKSKIVLILFMAVFTIAFSHSAAFAAPGDLDPSFGVGGKVITSCGVGNNSVRKVKALSDGSLIIASNIPLGGGIRRICVMKLTPNGSLDTSFGSGTGRVTQYVENESGTPLSSEVADLIIQPSGNIIILALGRPGGGLSPRGGLIALKPSGILETTFGGSGGAGKVLFPAWPPYPWPVMDSDELGNIYVSYRVYDVSSVTDSLTSYVMKFTPKGDFHSDADSTGHIWNSSTFVSADYEFKTNVIKIQKDGKIVLGGGLVQISSRILTKALIRLNSNGSVDYSFGFLGLSRIPEPPGFWGHYIHSLAFQTDGTIVALGFSNGVGGSLQIISPTGSLIRKISVWSSYWSKIITQSDDKILRVETRFGRYFSPIRHQADLSADLIWGGGAFVLTEFGGTWLRHEDAVLDPNEKLVIVGIKYNGSAPSEIAVARYLR